MRSTGFSETMVASQIEEAVISLEGRVRARDPAIVAVFVKPQTAKNFADHRSK
jgi:hypothetical protein